MEEWDKRERKLTEKVVSVGGHTTSYVKGQDVHLVTTSVAGKIA